LSLLTTYQPRPGFLTAIDLQPIPVQSRPVEIRSGNSLLSETPLTGMFAHRPVLDAVFVKWDGLLDVLSMDWLA
jgi:hypothetical protein